MELAQIDLDPSSVTAAVGLIFSLVGVIAITKKAVDFVAWVKNGNWDAVVKTVIAIVAAIALTFVLRETDFSNQVTVLGTTLDTMNNWTVAYIGLALGAIAAFGVDFLAARDNTRSSATAPIVGGPQPEG